MWCPWETAAIENVASWIYRSSLPAPLFFMSLTLANSLEKYALRFCIFNFVCFWNGKVNDRSSHRMCFVKENTCQSLFFNKVAGLTCRPNFINNETQAQMLSCEFCEVSKNTFFAEHLRATASEMNKLNERVSEEGRPQILWYSIFCLN